MPSNNLTKWQRWVQGWILLVDGLWAIISLGWCCPDCHVDWTLHCLEKNCPDEDGDDTEIE